jgi:hypothetical protein
MKAILIGALMALGTTAVTAAQRRRYAGGVVGRSLAAERGPALRRWHIDFHSLEWSGPTTAPSAPRTRLSKHSWSWQWFATSTSTPSE